MKIKKQKDTYNDYACELSFGQLMAIKNALASEHADPLADELFAELNWYLDNIPGPGESEEDLKAEEEAAQSGMASPEAAGQPLKPRADDLLPAPEEEGGAQGGGPPGEEGGAPGEDMAPPEGPPGEEAGGPPGGPPESEETETDRRLPPPPTE